MKVLVVEPDPALAKVLETSLAPMCDEVVIAASAVSAVEWVEDHGVPGVTVIDLELPDLEPLTLVALLRRRAGPTSPYFFVSRDPKVGARFDGSPVLTSPFEPIEARAVLRETLIENEARRAHQRMNVT